jgi:[glutamine synthetase] adenylyltransferase / [glutamine synthetase]-adenylyl-L-tyrosine phosphorylase
MRETTLAGQLAAMGFADTARAERLLTGDLRLDPAGPDWVIVEALAAAADPDLALRSLARLPEDAELRAALHHDEALRVRLMAVLGASAALGGHLARHPGDWRLLRGPGAARRPAAGELREELLSAVGARPRDREPVAGEEPRSADGLASGRPADHDPAAALRVAYRRRLLRLAARDLTGTEGLEEVAAELADLAAAALEAALAVARSRLPPGSPACRLAIIAMGKCGGRELNYASDVDVIFVAQDGEAAALQTATRLATGVIRVCSDMVTDGPLFPVDPNLRPEGRDGPMVRTVAGHRAYYQRWAKTWEFQALLKARPVAGDAALGEAYRAALEPMVWQASQREHFVADVQAMRRRVLASLPADQAGREIKLGPGGLRDIEFAVQLLQLVHGRSDETLRAAGTLNALAALARGGYVGRTDAASLAAAYRFLRQVEHLLQLRQLRRTHTLPEDPAVLRQVGRALRVTNQPPGPADPADDLIAQWRRHAGQARQLHEKLFYRPLLEAVSRLPGDAVRLTREAARARLEALGYADPAGALRHIEALTAGFSRRAAIQRTLLPVMLGWFADAAQPDAGLLAFRQVSEALGDASWYLRLLRDDTRVAERIARLLASSRYATTLLLRSPDAVAMLADDTQLAPRPAAALQADAMAVVRRHEGAAAAVEAVLALRRRELLRTAMADLLGLSGIEETGQALAEVTAAVIDAALEAAVREVEQQDGPLPTRLCVVAMGSFGGHEMGYASDADVMFVHEPCDGADEENATRAAHAVAEELRRLLARPGRDPALLVDAGLRPEGRQGPLVRTLGSYRAYYERWSSPWEAQALLRAEPVAGDSAVGGRFAGLADELRYPAGGISDSSVREVRRLKARMESERIPRGVDPVLHTKLGPGGLSDAEWVVQLLQLRHARALPALRTTRTLGALRAATDESLISAGDSDALAAAWRLAARIRNAVTLVRGRNGDSVPTSQPELGAVARLLGYPADAPHDLVQDYRRAARRARAVMERLFYG